ncbi:hypothetical protein VTL71DRAFT_3701 [Oculimacula yallundae]|uniref:Uncharacterized protein n=1 Tax=Oculimacula yallundae TaxID=86028 RepID=A0ABR4C5L7_9HELO
MAEIYNSATAIIIAGDGKDDNALLCPPDDALSRHRVGPDELVPGKNYLSFEEMVDARGYLAQLVTGSWSRKELAQTHGNGTGLRRPLDTKPILDGISQSHHNSRGWIFQERLLSRRRLYFLNNRLVFHCRRDMFSEDRDIEVKIVSDYLKLPVDPAETFHYYDDKVGSKRGHGSDWPIGMTSTSWDIGFRFWSSIVEGMPEPLLDFALLWVPVGEPERRPLMNVTGTNLTTSFPSGSWLGWRGGVAFPFTGTDSHHLTVESCVVDLENSPKRHMKGGGGWLTVRRKEGSASRYEKNSRKLFRRSSKAKADSSTTQDTTSTLLRINSSIVKGSSLKIGNFHISWLNRIRHKENYHSEAQCRDYISVDGKDTSLLKNTKSFELAKVGASAS